jgi:hypothetical protein
VSDERDVPKRKRLNTEEKRALKAAQVARFTSLYARKAQKGVEPNDRSYDREVERKVKRMSADDLDSLLRDDEE